MSESDIDLEHFRRLLLALEERLLEVGDTAEAAAQTVELDQTRVGRLSRMDAMQAQAMSQASNERRKTMLIALKAALLRLDKGEYGDCIKCGEAIGPRRLEFDPTLRTCIACAA
jgi:DnaK suppressor protein